MKDGMNVWVVVRGVFHRNWHKRYGIDEGYCPKEVAMGNGVRDYHWR